MGSLAVGRLLWGPAGSSLHRVQCRGTGGAADYGLALGYEMATIMRSSGQIR